ncbi:hypothetical protein Cni_G18533 [Canna indica]|uniref:Uncharacterized protein n=1 Tax=Canna indica TaxID=4628 RepID=A0AAQ3QIU5_9LILI|nr:hypothetical protein Cni_G18533 [Canna indica]
MGDPYGRLEVQRQSQINSTTVLALRRWRRREETKECRAGEMKPTTKPDADSYSKRGGGGGGGGGSGGGGVDSSRMKRDSPTLKTYSRKRKLNSRPPNLRMPSILFGDECAFCHSFRTTQATGPMSCYKDGKLMDVKEADRSNAIYVHQKCVEWAPKVYFSGGIMKNFEVELQRASKIKCNKCGLKGAALGCYFASCPKSFHVPCAVEIPECRWDCVNYHVLCPDHSSEKMPCDEDSNKNAQSTHVPSVQIESPKSSGKVTENKRNEQFVDPKLVGNERIFIGSDLMDSQKDLMDKFARLTGGTVIDSWRQDVTHVIASTTDSGACKITHNILLAILNGKWVLTTKWIDACMEVGRLAPEEPYEVKVDVHGLVDGPKKGRVRAKQKAQKLFAGLCFYISVYFTRSSKQSLKDLIVAAGGRVLEEDCLIVQYPFAEDPPFLYFIYNENPPKKYDPGDVMKITDERCQEAVEMFKNTGAKVISNTRVFDAIAALDTDFLYVGSVSTETVGQV